MKKLLILIMFCVFLTACNGKDDEIVIPADAQVAVCPQGDTFKYIYKDNTVYEFYSNDILKWTNAVSIDPGNRNFYFWLKRV